MSSASAVATEAVATETAAVPEIAPPMDVAGRLCLVPGTVVAEDGGAVYLGHGEIEPRWLRLGGRGLLALLELLDGRFSAADLLAAVPATARPAASKMLAELDRHDWLAAPGGEPAPERGSCLHRLEQLLGPAPAAPTVRRRVAVDGPAELAEPLVAALAARGVDVVAPSEKAEADLVLALAVGVMGAADLEDVPPDRPWLPVVVDGDAVRLGPLVRPGGPCYTCFRRRRAANLPPTADLPWRWLRPPETSPAAARLAVEAAALVASRHLAEATATLLETPGRGRVIDLARGDVALHTVLPVPFCRRCRFSVDEAESAVSRPVPPPVPGTEVFDPLCGLVKTCIDMPLGDGDPRVVYLATEATASPRLGTGVPEDSRFGCGVDVDRRAAAGAAMGEILERYSAAHYDPEALRYASFEQLSGELEATPPESFALFTGEQYRRFARHVAHLDGPRPRPFHRDTVTGWVAAESLRDGREVWLPAAFVYLPYRYRHGEPYFGDCLSTGIACGKTRQAAMLGALYEVIERDATAITWLVRLEPPRLRLEPGSELDRLYRERLAAPEMELRLLDLTLDVAVPTVAAFLLHQGGGTVVGTATRLDPASAARKALLEAVQGQLVWREPLRGGVRRRFAEDFSDVVQFSDHPRAYMAPEMRSRLDFLWRSPRESMIGPAAGAESSIEPSTESSLERCVEALAASGLEAFAVDVTSPDVRSLGYSVQRVVVPGMQPLNGRHDAPHLGGRRLLEVPRWFGRSAKGAARRACDLNSDPHPFP